MLGLIVFALLFYWRKKLARQANGLDKASSNGNGNNGNDGNGNGGSRLSEQARMMRAMAEQQRYASGVRPVDCRVYF